VENPDEDTELTSFHLAFLMITGVALVQQANPELVHFDKIGQNKKY